MHVQYYVARLLRNIPGRDLDEAEMLQWDLASNDCNGDVVNINMDRHKGPIQWSIGAEVLKRSLLIIIINWRD